MELKEYTLLPRDELLKRIDTARNERNAVILAHNYQRIEVQQIADYRGDSLGLAQQAAQSNAPVIVFCGVMFMAEVAKIISPERTVLIPEIQAGCPLAAYAAVEDLIALKREYPEDAVVTYVNSTAEIKAESDVVCTSANSVKIVESFPREQGIIFAPDKNLCYHTKKITGRKNIVCWDGNCYVHDRFTLADLRKSKIEYPEATIIVHPECPPKVQDTADMVASTGGMYRYVKEHPGEPVVLGTEIGMIERLCDEFPGTPVYPMSPHAICSNMKLITLEKVARALEEDMYHVEVPDVVAGNARTAIERMLDVK